MSCEPPHLSSNAPERPVVTPATKVLSPSLAGRVTHFDSVVDGWFEALRGHPFTDKAFYKASELGDYSLIWHLLGVALGQGTDQGAKRALRLSTVLAMESAFVNQVVKSAFRRPRPLHADPRPHRLRKPQTSSFPSGHASAAFTAAGLLSEDNALWPVFYAGAVVVASSRIYVRIHHSSDVVVGALLGAGFARLARACWPLE